MEVLEAPRFQSLSPVPGPERDTLPRAGAAGGVAVVADQLHALALRTAASAGRMDQTEAVEFAAAVEDLSRTVEYLQLAAAQAVDTAHRQARDPLVHAPDLPVSVFDEYRNTAEFLRARLRISAADARRRLHQAAALRPRLGLTGQIVPPKHEHLAAEVAAGTVSCKAAGIILRALDHVRPLCPAELTDRMEQDLATTATENDQDFLQRTAQRWVTAIDQDGPEPSEDELCHRQGAFIRPRTRGMNHLDIYAADEQFEHLLTVMNTATNPRISGNRDTNSTGTERAPGQDRTAADSPGGDGPGGDGSMFERRTRPQQLLDGLVTACKAALASGGLPATGGHRPQVLVTIGYEQLTDILTNADARTATGLFAFTGPVNARTIRRIACDADILPVVLNGQGRILDLGRSSRIFPPHLRKALAARDKGCAFPGCTIPAPWCEAHHLDYWSRGGTTSTDSGILACTYHHHLLHKEQWKTIIKNGIPWFIPPPELDPTRTPRRNTYFTI